jgi:hypothetical protein
MMLEIGGLRPTEVLVHMHVQNRYPDLNERRSLKEAPATGSCVCCSAAVHTSTLSRTTMSEPASAPAAAVVYRPYPGEAALAPIAALVEGELSEPYVVYTYRYFLHQWSVRACRPPSSRALNACSA